MDEDVYVVAFDIDGLIQKVVYIERQNARQCAERLTPKFESVKIVREEKYKKLLVQDGALRYIRTGLAE